MKLHLSDNFNFLNRTISDPLLYYPTCWSFFLFLDIFALFYEFFTYFKTQNNQ